MTNQPIAIIGMGCRFPGGASSPNAFWELLCNGVDWMPSSALIGTPESCAPILDQLSAIGVDKVASFIDFGVNQKSVLENQPYLNALFGIWRAKEGNREGLPLHIDPQEGNREGLPLLN